MRQIRFCISNFKKFAFFEITIIAFLFSGCASFRVYNPATERHEFIFISTKSEVGMGKDIHKQLLRQFKLSNDSGLNDRIQRIGYKIAQFSDRQDYLYHFYVIENDELNAFTTPGGNIYVFTGLMEKIKSDDEIAAILSHEIGHCAARHTVKKFQAALGYNLIGSLILSSIDRESQMRNVVKQSTGTVMRLVFSAYGRNDEYEADKLGLKYMNLAGFGLDGMIKTLAHLEENSKGNVTPLILRTHPYLKDRIIRVKEEIKNIKEVDSSHGTNRISR